MRAQCTILIETLNAKRSKRKEEFMKKTFHAHIGLFLVCGFFLLIGFFSLNQMIVYTPDSARYLVWANSLAHGEGFKDATTPETTRYVVHAPLYSLLLTPSAFFFSQNVIAAKATTLLIGCLALFLFYFWLKPKVGRPFALLGSSFLALNSFMVLFSTQILSDVPFAVCLILFFMFAEKLAESEKPSRKLKLGFIAVIIAGIFMREVGFTLMLGATIFFVFRKKYRTAALIFFGTLLIYFLWFIRNEIIIAGTENPALRNMNILFTHLYTSNRESLFTEFAKRIQDNFFVYKNLIGKLVFLSGFPKHSSPFISASDPLVGCVLYAFSTVQFILVGATVVMCVAGLWYESKKSRIFSLLMFYLICYIGFILIYPINDVRFLFPILLIMVYLCVISMKYFYKWMITIRIPLRHAVIGTMALILLIPNCIWLNNFVKNSWQYRQSPEQLNERLKKESQYPWFFTKPLYLAAEWITQHSDSSIVVMSRWKELTFGLQGRKIIEASPQISPDYFDGLLRDYSVKYIVGVVYDVGLNEYESIMTRSRLFLFDQVYNIGNVEIFKVLRMEQKSWKKGNDYLPDSTTRSLCHKALCILEDNPKEAERILRNLMVNNNTYPEGTFHIGIAKEFELELDSAAVQFEKLRLMQQAGAFVYQASYHLGNILLLKQTMDTSLSWGNAQRFSELAARYWALGYRKQAMNMLHRSLEVDPQYLLSYVLAAYYSFQQGDTLLARKNMNQAQALDSTDSFVKGFALLLRYYNSLPDISDRSQQNMLRLKIVDSYIALGLQENAIDELQNLLYLDPVNQIALRAIAGIYEMKKEYAPAMYMYKRLALINYSDMAVQRKVIELSKFCQ
jgi:tetratricopeptide (TPR) repeat protein